MKELASSDSSLSYRRIRAPKDHGSTLHIPKAAAWNDLWRANCSVELPPRAFQFDLTKDMFAECRAEILQTALDATRRYRDVDFSDRESNRIIMAGHQPTLFHAGVWYKNFVLDQLAENFNCYAINLIVDNDVCNAASISVPISHDQELFSKSLKYDSTGPVVPFESRVIQDREQFNKFGSAVESAIRPFVKNPLIRRLWPITIKCAQDAKLGMAIAMGRHRLEGEIGLQTLEITVSDLSTTHAFAIFSREILLRLPDFCQVYNDVADGYRRIHKIKNLAQPIPNLKNSGNWLETPFWIWSSNDPVRRSLFAKLTTDSLVMSDRSGFDRTIAFDSFLDEFLTLPKENISIRPKALITTLFSRMLGCDLFIHGIGGAKYDQLTDELYWRFFKSRLPDYLTVSGTFLIQQAVPRIDSQQINRLRHRLRETRYHPERFVQTANAKSQQLIEQKEQWVGRKLPAGKRLQRHKEIEICNHSLQEFISDDVNAIRQELARLESEFHDSRVLNSREHSFCLHDESLLDLLRDF